MRRPSWPRGHADRGVVPRPLQTLLDSACRAHGIAFFAGDVFGMLGYIFSDLGRHEYTVYVDQT